MNCITISMALGTRLGTAPGGRGRLSYSNKHCHRDSDAKVLSVFSIPWRHLFIYGRTIIGAAGRPGAACLAGERKR